MPASGGVPASGLSGRDRDFFVRGANALMLSTVLSSAFGFAFWVVAARVYSPHELGQDSAAISALLMLSNFAQLNLFFGLTRFVPIAGRFARRLVVAAYAACSVASVLLAAGFLLIAPHFSDLEMLARGPGAKAIFIGAVVLWGLFALQDAVLAGSRKADWIPVENALFGLVKLGSLLLVAGHIRAGVFTSWNVAVLLAVVPVNYLLFRRVLPRAAATAEGHTLHLTRVARFVAVDYVGTLFLQLYTTALPLLVVALLGAEANGRYYVAYVIVSALDLLSVNLATSLLVEGARDEGQLGVLSRRTVRRVVAIVVPAVAFMVLSASYLLAVFGAQYAEGSSTTLRLLALGSLPRAVGIVYMSTLRVRRRVSGVVLIQAGTATVIIVAAAGFAPWLGVIGVALAWLLGHTAVAVAVAPKLFRVLRGEGGPPSASPDVAARLSSAGQLT